MAFVYPSNFAHFSKNGLNFFIKDAEKYGNGSKKLFWLIKLISRTPCRCGEESMSNLKDNMVDRVVKQIEHLPTLPQVVMKVVALAESPSVTALELSKAMDQSLAAKVLKVANSAFYGARGPKVVSSLQHAIVRIGFDTVKEIILTTSMFHTFHDTRDVKALQPLWCHSMECALIGKRLAWIFRFEPMDEAYLAGLTHDLGKLVIQQYFPEQYLEIESKKNAGIEEMDAETEVMEITHAGIGGKIAQRWGFPPAIGDAIMHHHDRDWQVNPILGRILHYADQFVSGNINFPQLLDEFSAVGLHHPSTWDSSDLESVESILIEEKERAQSMFDTTTDSRELSNMPLAE
jgi:putative nucleotidyltransferase with HDIG domain